MLFKFVVSLLFILTITVLPTQINSKPAEKEDDYEDATESDDDDEVVSFDDRIRGGKRARLGSYPFQVSLQERNSDGSVTRWCGGSIILPKWILTAAHCYEDKDLSKDLRVNAGVINAWDYGATSQFIKVDKAFIHPGYRGKATQFENDIALVKLQEPLKFNSYVQKVGLPPKDYVATRYGKIIGWGATESSGGSDWLRVAIVPVSPKQSCDRVFASTFKPATQICLSAGRQQKTCGGDSGGPFLQKINGKLRVVGITSYGTGGCKANDPSVDTNVAAYLDFIKDTISKNT